MSLELMTLTNANGARLEPFPRGGVRSIEVDDVLGALQGCESGVVRLVLVLVCGQDVERQRLAYDLTVRMADSKAVRHWVSTHKGLIQPLSNLAVEEYLDTKRCRPCKGSGKRYSKQVEGLETCSFCNGSGNSGYSIRDRAARLGIARAQWDECKTLYDLMLDQLFAWQVVAKRRMQGLRQAVANF